MFQRVLDKSILGKSLSLNRELNSAEAKKIRP